MNKIIFLVGFRAVGKTTVGCLLAKKIGCSFQDTDILISEQQNLSVREIVIKEGWDAFRAYEKNVLKTVSTLSSGVFATGGGAVLHQEVWPKIQEVASVVWLTADQEIIISRIQADNSNEDVRPSLSGKGAAEEVSEILKERFPLYQTVSDFSVDTGRLTVDEAVEYIMERL